MKKKLSKKQLRKIEKEMQNPMGWEPADHLITYKGSTSVHFSDDMLKKLHAIAQIRKKPIDKLINEFIKPFVEGEYSILEQLK